MSITVEDILKLPSMRQAKVLGGKGGLNKVVSSISVLESVDPEVLVKEVFPQDTAYGSELVITGFLNCIDDVDLQCSNLMRLAQGGEVGLVLYYVGVYLPRVDERLIALADQLDFVLICMPEGQRHLRYSNLISDVTECIFRDRAKNVSLVSDILARISKVPHHHQTVDTAMQMLCVELACSVILCDENRQILNLFSWPRGMEDVVRAGVEQTTLPNGALRIPCQFLEHAELYQLPIFADLTQPLRLILIRDGEPLSQTLLDQVADLARICINIWGRRHGSVAIHELMRAILQDEPLKMRRLADIFHVDIASIHELWMLCGAQDPALVTQRMEEDLALARQCANTVIGSVFEGQPVMCLSTPHSLKEAERVMQELLSRATKTSPGAVVVRCSGLSTTTDCRRAYVLTLENLADARRIFPHKQLFLLGELELAADCRKCIGQGESAAAEQTLPLSILQTDKEEFDLAGTLCAYLLDGELSVTRTAELLYLHKNTVKYRLQRISDLLGFRPGKMPETIALYRSAAIYRLLKA